MYISVCYQNIEIYLFERNGQSCTSKLQASLGTENAVTYHNSEIHFCLSYP